MLPDSVSPLMTAAVHGLNFYLAKHSDVHPKSIQKFEPWMALSFTEGSIGGDFEKVNLGGLQTFYGHETPAPPPPSTQDDCLDDCAIGWTRIAKPRCVCWI